MDFSTCLGVSHVHQHPFNLYDNLDLAPASCVGDDDHGSIRCRGCGDAIARSLVTSPSILMGDEPTGNLDSKTSREVIELFKKLNEERQITVILVTHDLHVARHARRILVLRDGLIVTDTTRFEDAFESLHSFEAEQPEPQSALDQSEN